MKWFDSLKVRRVFSHANHISPELELSMVVGVYLYGFQRRMLQENIIRPLKGVLAKSGSSFGWGHYQLTASEQTLLERESALAAIACGEIIENLVIIEGRTLVPKAAESLLLNLIRSEEAAEKNEGRQGRSIAVDYSAVHQEALGQLIIAWGSALKIDHPGFKTALLASDLPENWNVFRAFLGGALLGMTRNPFRPMLEKAVSIVVDMPEIQRRRTLEMLTSSLFAQATEEVQSLSQKNREGIQARNPGEISPWNIPEGSDANDQSIDAARAKAENGDPGAQFILGILYSKGERTQKDLTEAAKWFLKAAKQGHREAQFNIGYAYRFGLGVPNNWAGYGQAVNWFRKAAEQGHPGAQSNLGLHYHNGQAVDQDYTEAVKWYRMAAEQDDTMAQVNLGGCYLGGVGVSKDLIDAYVWLSIAASKGDQKATDLCREAALGLSPHALEQARARAQKIRAKIQVRNPDGRGNY